MAEVIRVAKKAVGRNIAISRSDSRRIAFVGSSNRYIEARWDRRLRYIDLINTSRSFRGAVYRRSFGNLFSINPGGSCVILGSRAGSTGRPSVAIVAHVKLPCQDRALYSLRNSLNFA